MKKMFQRIKDTLKGLAQDQSGIGVVEIILILVKIFTGKSVCILCI